MSRYLTPTKIALLVLIRLYCSKGFHVRSSLHILSFIASILAPNIRDNASITTSLSLDDFEKELHNENNEIWKLFIIEMSQLNDLDTLFKLYDDLQNLFVEQSKAGDQHRLDSTLGSPHRTITLSKTSLMGSFVRRASLEFERLQFYDAMELWRKFELFKEPLLDQLSHLLTSGGDLDAGRSGDNIDQLQLVIHKSLAITRDRLDQESTADVERLFDFQIQKMQKHGTRLPENTTAIFRSLLRPNAVKSGLSHYVSFLDSWYSGDYCSAFENLHRYYDYALNNKDRSNYQYALLNMAILQADFKCYNEAIIAMKEAIATARENKDTACLSFCLSWLYHFQTTNLDLHYGNNGKLILGCESEDLSFMKIKAKVEKMWNIMSSVLLGEARHCLANGRRPMEAFERIYESSDLNVRHRLNSMEGSQCLVQSGIFARFGLSGLSKSYCDLIEDCHKDDSGVDNLSNARCRTAYLLALSGNYKAANSILEPVDIASPLNFKATGLQILYRKVIMLKRSLHNNELQLAHTLLDSLRSSSKADIELQFQVLLLEIDYLKRQKDFPAALDLLEKSTTFDTPLSTDIFQKIRSMTAKALLFNSCGHPSKGLSVAVRAATAAFRAKILYATWEAIAALAIVLNGLEEYSAASAVLEAIVYQASECKDGTLATLIQNALADAWTGLAMCQDNGSRGHSMFSRKTLNWLDSVQTSYRQLEDVAGQRLAAAKEFALSYKLGDIEATGTMKSLCPHDTKAKGLAI